MPGYLKVSGTHRLIALPYIKVAGAWRAITLGYIKVAGAWRIWYAANVSDNFNRANGALGTASDGFSAWEALRGTWSVSNNKAYSTTSGSTYPLAAVPIYKSTTDVTVKVDNPDNWNGGAAFWVEDANNWYGAYTYYDVDSTSYYYCPSGGSLSGTTCTLTTSPTCRLGERSRGCRSSSSCDAAVDCTYGCGWDLGGTTPSGVVCNADSGLGYCYEYFLICDVCPSGYTYNGSTCVFTYSATLATDTSYTRTARLIRMSGGSVSTLASGSVSSRPLSIQVSTSGNDITAQFYSSASQTGTLLRTLSYNVSLIDTPPANAKVGIMKGATNDGETSTLDNFSGE